MIKNWKDKLIGVVQAASLVAGFCLNAGGCADVGAANEDQLEAAGPVDGLDEDFRRKLPNTLNGLWPQWKPYNGDYREVLTSGGYFQEVNYPAGFPRDGIHNFMKYLIKCAMPAGAYKDYWIAGYWFKAYGGLGYGRQATNAPASGDPFNSSNYNNETFTRAVSTCLGAHYNGGSMPTPGWAGFSYGINLASAQTGYGPYENLGAIDVREGSVYGDLFNGNRNLYFCWNGATRPLYPRECYMDAAGAAVCPFVFQDQCAPVCDGNGAYINGNAPNCWASNGVWYNKPIFIQRRP